MENYSYPRFIKFVSKLMVVLGLSVMANSLAGQFGPLPLPGGERLFETQADVDAFTDEGLIAINGSVRIADNGTDPIINLDGFSGLNVVFGSLTVEGNSQLTSYCGLVTLLESNGLLGTFEVTGNFWDPAVEEILTECEFVDPEEELTLEEILQILQEDGVLNKGHVNSLRKQAKKKSLRALSNHLDAFIRAGILTEDEAGMIYNAVLLESEG